MGKMIDVKHRAYNPPINKAKIIKNIISYFCLILFSLFFLVPFIYMICVSFLTDKESVMNILFTRTGFIHFGAYKLVLKNSSYIRYFGNTLLTSCLGAIGVPLSASLCAFSFSKLNYKGRKTLFAIVLATMMLPGIVTQIPLYTVYVKLHWDETLLPLWLPGWFGGGAVNIFLMFQFMKGIPKDLNNAAKIDGAGTFRTFTTIIMPMCIPIFLYVMIMSFIGSWNDFMTPLLYITDKAKFTLSLGVYNDFKDAPSAYVKPNAAMAAGVIMMLPCLILFFAFQRFLIDGVAITGLKG